MSDVKVATVGVIPGFEQCEALEGLDPSVCGYKDLTVRAPGIVVPKGTRREFGSGFVALDGNASYPITVHLSGPGDVGFDGTYSRGSFDYFWGHNWASQDPQAFFTWSVIGHHADSPAYWFTDINLESFDSLMPNADVKMNLRVNAATQPGKYRVSFPITEIYDGSLPDGSQVDPEDNMVIKSETVTRDFIISANPINTSITTDVERIDSKGKTKKIIFKVFAPGYQKGAKATIYYQKKGTKSWKSVASGTLGGGGDMAYKSMTTKKGAIRYSGKYFARIGSVAYSPGFDKAAKTIK